MFNMQGQLIYSENISNMVGKNVAKELDITTYPKGIYHLQVTTDKEEFNKKVVVN